MVNVRQIDRLCPFGKNPQYFFIQIGLGLFR